MVNAPRPPRLAKDRHLFQATPPKRFSATVAEVDGGGAARPPALVFASPHSGTYYPPELVAAARVDLAELRRGEDALVDRLLAGVAGPDAITVSARHARAYVDLNRDPGELDPEMFAPPLPAATLRASDRVAAGLGVIPRALSPGQPIYAAPLPASEAAARLAAAHAPWHALIEARLAAARAAHGYAILIDCHSMPTPPGARPPAIVVGDLQGRSAAPALVVLAEALLRARGLSVARNDPYAGAYTLERHGRPWAGTHAIQLEIDRARYLDSGGRAPGRGFAAMQGHLAALAAGLADGAARLALGAPAARLAAE